VKLTGKTAAPITIPKHRPLAEPLRLLVMLAATCGLFFAIAFALAGVPVEVLQSPLVWLRNYDPGQARDLLANIAQVLAAVLAVAVTVVAIVVELAANRYSHEITRLFLREPVNLMVLGLLVVTTVVCIWTVTVTGNVATTALLPQAGFVAILATASLCLLLLVPYMYFVFTFLSPISVIERICRDAYRAIVRARAGDAEVHQARVLEAFDKLQDVARSALQQGDRGIALAAVDATAELLFDYARVRERLPAEWFMVSATVRNDADFLALAAEYVEEIRSGGTWLEQKLLRRYHGLLGQASPGARDVAYRIGINTARIATEIGRQNPEVLELAIRAFNSYLRTTIGTRDLRTAYYLLHLYRQVASARLEVSGDCRAIDIAAFLGEYGRLAHKAGLSFLLETAAHDLVELIEDAAMRSPESVDVLLGQVLALDEELRAEEHVESLLGVRRAQMQLATFLLEKNWQERARRVARDLAVERPERLNRLRQGFETDDRQQFWELTDRGLNFAWLSPARRTWLPALMTMIDEKRRNTTGAA
jgi:hypothetical protein